MWMIKVIAILILIPTLAYAAMSQQEKEALIKQVWESEVQYIEAKNSYLALKAKSAPTPDEQTKIIDLEKKLNRDLQLITQWLQTLKQEGVTKAELLSYRNAVLEEQKNRIQQEVQQLTMREDLIAYEVIQQQATLDAIREMKQKREQYRDFIGNITNSTTVWKIE